MATKKRSIIDDLRDSFTGLFSAPKTTTVSTPTTTKTTMPTNNWQLQKAIEKRNDPVAFEAKYPTVSSIPQQFNANRTVPKPLARPDMGKIVSNVAGGVGNFAWKNFIEPIVNPGAAITDRLYAEMDANLTKIKQDADSQFKAGKINAQKYNDINNKLYQSRSKIAGTAGQTENAVRTITSPVRNVAQGIVQSVPKTAGSVVELAGNLGQWATPKGNAENFFKGVSKFGSNIGKTSDRIATDAFQTKKDNQVVKNLGQSGGELLTDIATGKIVLKGLGMTKYADDAIRLQKMAKTSSAVQNLISGKYAARVFNDTYSSAKQAGKSDTQAGITATGNAAVQAIIERVSGVGKYLDKLGKGTISKIIVNALKESGEEGGQQLVDNIAKLTINPPTSILDFTTRLTAGVGTSALYGGIMGGTASGMTINADTDATRPTAAEVPGGTPESNLISKLPLTNTVENIPYVGNVANYEILKNKAYSMSDNDISILVRSENGSNYNNLTQQEATRANKVIKDIGGRDNISKVLGFTIERRSGGANKYVDLNAPSIIDNINKRGMGMSIQDVSKITTKTIQDNHVKLAQSLDTVAPGSPEQVAVIEQMKANQQAKAEAEQALTPEAGKVDDIFSNYNKRYHQTSPEVADIINKEGFRLDKRASGANDVLPIGVNTKLTDKNIRLPKTGSQLEVYFDKNANIKKFENRNQAEQFFYGHPDGSKYRSAVDKTKQLDIDYQSKIDEVGKQIDVRYKELYNTGVKTSDDAQYKLLQDKEQSIIDEWGKKVNEQSQIAQSESTKIAKKEGIDAIDITQDTGGFGSVTDNTIILDPAKIKTKQQLSTPQVTKTEVPASQDIVNIDSNENAIREIASEYRTAKEYQDELTDLVWSNNKKGQGVEFINNENKYEPGFDIKRISNNTPFYRQFFAENGRKPTKGEIATLIDDYLNGKDNIMKYELAPEEVDVFNIIKDNESAPLDVIEKSAPLSQPVDNIPEIAKQVTKPKVTKTVSEKAAKTAPQTRGFVESVQKASNVDAAVKKGVEGLYAPKTNKTLMGEAIALLNEGTTIDFKNIKNLDQKVAATMQEAINQQAAGNNQAVADLFNNLSEHGTEIARGLQAFSLLENMSPEAVSLSVAGRIKKYNATHPNNKIPELTGEQQKVISDKIIAADLLTGRDKNIAMNELNNTISGFIPSSIVDKALAVWKAGLLTSFRTHERNFVGNTIHGIAEMAKDVPAAGADVLMSKKTGQRTLTATTKGTRDFASKSTRQQIADIVSKGYDPSESLNKFDYKKITWGDNKIEQGLKKYTDIVFNTLGAADKPFYNAAMARSLYDQAGAAAINAGKRGDKVFIENLVKNPTEDMVKIATGDANVATFKDKNAATNVVNQLKQGLGKTEAGKLIGEVTMPFTGVPTSILGQIQAYSPIGLVKGIAKTGKVVSGKVPELQRRAAQELGRGVIGTGIYGLGAYLAGLGLITGQPKDTEESKQWELENKPRNSIMIGGKWRSLNSIGPEAVVFLAGAKLSEELGREDGSIANYATTLGKDYLDQSFVTGLQGPINAITDPARYGKYYAGNTISSVIPNIVKDASKAFDSSARESNTVSDYAKQGIPFLRQRLTEKRDVLGNVIKQQPTGIGAFVDLFNSKTPVNNDVVNELGRLYKAGESATPSKMSAKYTVDGEKVELTPAELNNLEIKSGTAINAELDKLVKSSEYQSADDETKKNTIDTLIRDIRSEAKLSTASGTDMSTSDIATKARNKLTLDQFDKSGENYLEKDGYVYTRDEDGDAKVTTKIKYDYNLNKATLTKLKSDGNLDGWLKQADLQARNIYEQMNNENISPIEKLSLENELNSLIGNISKYTSYGGFTKGSTKGSSKSDTTTKAEIAKILSILNSTRDTSNDTYKTLNSLLQGTRSYTKPSVQKVALKKITVKK